MVDSSVVIKKKTMCCFEECLIGNKVLYVK